MAGYIELLSVNIRSRANNCSLPEGKLLHYQIVYAVRLTLKYKKFYMGLFLLGVLSKRISNVEKMYMRYSCEIKRDLL